MRRITGVQYQVEIDGRQCIAAWKSPYRVTLFDRATREIIAKHTPDRSTGSVSLAAIAAASDAAPTFRLSALQ